MENYLKPSVCNPIVDENGREFRSARQLAKYLNICKDTILKRFHRNEPFRYNGHTYYLCNNESITCCNTNKPNTSLTEINENEENLLIQPYYSEEYSNFLKTKDVSELPFEKYDFTFAKKKGGNKYAVALFSDAHIEEIVDSNSVLGLNEYDLDIAKKRIETYFVNLAEALNNDDVDDLIFASLGDTISGYIHEELSQTNSCSPLEATFIAQNLIYNGLEYLINNTDLRTIKFIGIVGNHSRTTKKIQHSNGYKMSYEYLMYKNIEKQCQLTNLPIEFCIPESEMAIVEADNGKRFIFIHGFQIRGGNGIAGILPSLNRTVLKWERVFHQDKVYLGHFHNFMSQTNVAVNGSVIGYNSYALTNALPYEKPLQLYDLYDSNDLILTRRIYCE